MKRKIYKKLLEWKNSDSRKPLIIQGARQVGKTYIVNIFGANEYSNVIYCNFEKDESLSSFFSNLEPTEIIKKISNYKRKEILKKHSLIIFDEVQACPRALTSLKYFCEEENDYHIIALGSLLGISLNRNEFSFPVGKVDIINMYPMDFEEFLMACKEDNLINEIKYCYNNNKALDEALHKKALEYYKSYLYVGGMPEVVFEFLNNHNNELVRVKQQVIIDSYFNDMSKYNKQTEIPKTKIIYKNISTQLAKENKKFKYSEIKKGGRASEFELSIEWVCLSGIAKRLFRLENIMLPLNAYESTSDFKFYMNDVGLLCCCQNILFDDIIFENPFLDNFKGGLVENYVFNQLASNYYKCYYWTSKNQAEVDFVTRIGKNIIPIEVKACYNNKSKSLNVYIDRFKPEYAIRISTRNFGFENNIKSVPLYAVFCI